MKVNWKVILMSFGVFVLVIGIISLVFFNNGNISDHTESVVESKVNEASSAPTVSVKPVENSLSPELQMISDNWEDYLFSEYRLWAAKEVVDEDDPLGPDYSGSHETDDPSIRIYNLRYFFNIGFAIEKVGDLDDEINIWFKSNRPGIYTLGVDYPNIVQVGDMRSSYVFEFPIVDPDRNVYMCRVDSTNQIYAVDSCEIWETGEKWEPNEEWLSWDLTMY